MNIVHINTYDIQGGAAIACNRLNNALNKKNINSSILVQEKKSKDSTINSIADSYLQKKLSFARLLLEKALFFRYEKNPTSRFAFSTAKTGIDISKNDLILKADIINLHWINFGFISLKTLEKLFALNKPIVWTLHDMWPFTGGCHHSYECLNFTNKCGNCMYLKQPKVNDLSNKLLLKKKLIYSNTNMHIVSVSSWLKNRAKSSNLFKSMEHYVIHNTVNTNYLVQINKEKAKQKLKLNTNKKYLLFNAPKIDDPVKGFKYFSDALNILKQKKWNSSNEFEILLVGSIKKNKNSLLSSLPFQFNYLGYVSQELLPVVYSAAEISVVTSKYETFGQTISESMACETPVIAFNHSGPIDIIDHKINGYLAEYKSPEDISNGILWIINNSNFENIKANARKKIINSFNEDIISNKYIELYKSILN